MTTAKVREEGFSKDADKLVRRLSLVALLLSRRGQPVSAAEIRSRVEGYPLMTEEAFKKRFSEDRSELAGLGVEVEAEPADDGSELYSLPADAYYLPAIELTHEELTALAACLAVLEDRFAYSQPLRLALLSLAQGLFLGVERAQILFLDVRLIVSIQTANANLDDGTVFVHAAHGAGVVEFRVLVLVA